MSMNLQHTAARACWLESDAAAVGWRGWTYHLVLFTLRLYGVLRSFRAVRCKVEIAKENSCGNL
jgi:hypothetical protein